MLWKFRKSQKSESQGSETNEIREGGRAPLSEITKQVKRIEITTRKKTASQLAGQYKSRFRGQGMQFSDFRVYQFGDDIRHIDWRASAKSDDTTYIKTFEEERELNVMLVADLSASMNFGSTGQSKKECMQIALANIAFSAALNSDKVGLVLFTDVVEKFIPPKKGRKHVLRLIDELITYKPKGKRANINSALQILEKVAKAHSTIVIASDLFMGLGKDRLRRLSRKNDLIVMRLQDQRDGEFPSIGLVKLEDPESGESYTIDTNSAAFREELRKHNAHWESKTNNLILQSGCSQLSIATGSDVAKELMRFFHSRRRMAR